MAAPAYDNSAKQSSAANVASLTTAAWTIGGSNRYLVAGAASGAGTPVAPTAVRWEGSGGTALTQRGSTINTGSNFKSGQYSLLAPNAASGTLYCLWPSNQDETALIGVSAKDVDQASPIGTQATATGTNTSPTVNATTVADDFVVDFVWFGDTGCNNRTLAVNASQLSRQEIEGATLACEGAGSSTEVATTTSTTMSWTISGAIVGGWAIFALPLKPVSAGGRTTKNTRAFPLGMEIGMNFVGDLQ